MCFLHLLKNASVEQPLSYFQEFLFHFGVVGEFGLTLMVYAWFKFTDKTVNVITRVEASDVPHGIL